MRASHLDNELSVVPFRYKYLKALHDILNSNEYLGISEVNMKTLPKTGYMVLMNGHPIAAGFLRRVEGGYAQIDTLTSNRYFGSQIRHLGIKLVVETLVNEAKTLKLKGIIAFTKDEGILKRAKEIGFIEPKETIIALKL